MSSTTPTPVPSFNSIFQSPGGPPLILVCIAAGLLLGAFLGILLMRRIRPTIAVQRMHGINGFPDPQKKLGEKPKLLDVHIVPRSDPGGVAGAGGEPGRWQGLFPFAALHLQSPDASAASGAPPSSASPGRNEIWRRRLLARIPAQLRPFSRRTHDPHAPAKTQVGDGTPSLREVQLAVMVSMPSPHPLFTPTPPKGTGTGIEKEKANEGESESEKDPLSVRISPVHDPLNDARASQPKHHEDSAHDSPIPDCCIGTLVVSYRPPLGPGEPGTMASAP
ncbi:hypothetical protein C8T65DRAFT_693596 [Cerioporus squamosus]|nr:hypothetical protein C8T65DRAFT_693596 [Cerioporus squamosus]